MKPIYFDHAAAAPLHSEVLDRMIPYMTEHFGNPSSLHSFGREARAAVTSSRDRMAAALGMLSRELIFTSGGTESDNLAIHGLAAANGHKGHVVTTQIEHHAVLHSCERLEELGVHVTYLPVDRTGRLNPEHVREAIRPDTFLVTVMLGNNEVGTLQPIREIGGIAREAGVFFHVDAVQALGSVEMDLSELPVDLMSFSSHKIRGPKGIGALYVSDRVKLVPQLYGGLQERGKRAGTENVPGIVGFGAAAELALGKLQQNRAHLDKLRTMLLSGLSEHLQPDAFVVNGNSEHRLPHILNISFPGITSETMLMNLDLEGIAAASGSACTSGSLEVSHVLKAMGLPDEVTNSAVRFSFGPTNTEEEVERAAKIIGTIVRRIRK